MSIWVKICGITNPGDAAAAVRAGADAIGVNFHRPSVRYVDATKASEIVDAVPPGYPVYGVFVDQTRPSVVKTAAAAGLRGIQLHGDEPEAMSSGWELPVIRAVGAVRRSLLSSLLGHSFDGRILIDNPRGGGSGQVVTEGILDGLDLGQAILAGGLTPSNVAAMVARYRPFGVDVAGGVESAPGIKDHEKIKEFVEHARRA